MPGFKETSEGYLNQMNECREGNKEKCALIIGKKSLED